MEAGVDSATAVFFDFLLGRSGVATAAVEVAEIFCQHANKFLFLQELTYPCASCPSFLEPLQQIYQRLKETIVESKDNRMSGAETLIFFSAHAAPSPAPTIPNLRTPPKRKSCRHFSTSAFKLSNIVDHIHRSWQKGNTNPALTCRMKKSGMIQRLYARGMRL